MLSTHLVVLLLLFILMLLVWIYWDWVQRIYILYPERETYSISELGVEERKFEGIYFLYLQPISTRKIILYCHGTTGNVTTRSEVIKICKCFGLGLVIFDYMGYGRSDGQASLNQLLTDGAKMYRYLIDNEKIDPKNIVVWGESLGGAVASYVASNYQCSSLVICSSFSSLDTLARLMSKGSTGEPFIKPLTHVLPYLVNTMPSSYWISKVKCPVVIVHSIDDNIIPAKEATVLFDSIPHQDKLMLWVTGTHDKLIMNHEILCDLLNFIGFDSRKVDVCIHHFLGHIDSQPDTLDVLQDNLINNFQFKLDLKAEVPEL